MREWRARGCSACRDGVLSGSTADPEEIAVADGPVFLHRCRACGAYWECNLRECHVIDEEEARRVWPHAFPGSS